MIEMSSHKDPNKRVSHISAHVSDMDLVALGPYVVKDALNLIAEAIAQEWIEAHMQDVLTKIDPQAVANLVVAEAGAGIRDAIYKKFPDKIVEVHKREFYQRGLLGGLRRIG
jgi:hypothetical protein